MPKGSREASKHIQPLHLLDCREPDLVKMFICNEKAFLVMYMSPAQDPSSMCITSPLNRTPVPICIASPLHRTPVPTDLLEMDE